MRVITVTPEDLKALIQCAVREAIGSVACADDRLLTSEDVAKILGVSPRSIPKLVSRDALPVTLCVGRSYRFQRATIDAWITSRAELSRRHTGKWRDRSARVRSVR